MLTLIKHVHSYIGLFWLATADAHKQLFERKNIFPPLLKNSPHFEKSSIFGGSPLDFFSLQNPGNGGESPLLLKIPHHFFKKTSFGGRGRLWQANLTGYDRSISVVDISQIMWADTENKKDTLLFIVAFLDEPNGSLCLGVWTVEFTYSDTLLYQSTTSTNNHCVSTDIISSHLVPFRGIKRIYVCY